MEYQIIVSVTVGTVGTKFDLFRNSQLSTLYSSVKSRTEMTTITTVRYQGNALTDTFNADRVQCLTF